MQVHGGDGVTAANGAALGALAAAQDFIRTELPRVDHLAALCLDGEDGDARARPDGF